MAGSRRAFTLVEAVISVLLVALLLILMLPLRARSAQPAGLVVSLNNVRRIIQAHWDYRNSNADQVPMRGSRYSNGQLQGWDNWSNWGKNTRQPWTTVAGGLFDQSAYSRALNSYIYPDVGIARPQNYVNTGSGSTWTFNGGTPLPADRANLQLPAFRSPGDSVTYQGNIGGVPYGQANPALSGYDDIGTSYMVNMKWWDQPDLAGLSFTPRFNAGVARIRALTSTPAIQTFVWVSDQICDVVAFNPAPSTGRPGEFGGTNMSVCGFLDGRADYIEIIPGAFSGPGYTLNVPPPPGPPPPPPGGLGKPRAPEPRPGCMINHEWSASR